MKHYDYMIVGAGPAGCFAAAMLAERGWKVIVLERREKGFCKLCGDGISVQAVHVLRQAGFPAERLEAAGAVRIKTVCHKRGDTLSRMTLGDEQRAYALSRRTTDALFRAKGFGAEIVYGEDVRELSRNGTFRYRDREADRLIIATGVASNIRLDGKRLLRFCSRPVGVSAIVRGKRAENGYYLFDWRRCSCCTPRFMGIFRCYNNQVSFPEKHLAGQVRILIKDHVVLFNPLDLLRGLVNDDIHLVSLLLRAGREIELPDSLAVVVGIESMGFLRSNRNHLLQVDALCVLARIAAENLIKIQLPVHENILINHGKPRPEQRDHIP